MSWSELSATLAELVRGVQAPAGSGLVVTSAEMDVPLEVAMGFDGDELVFYGRVPHSRWSGGFQQQAQLSHIEVVAIPAGGPPAAGDGGGR